MIPIALLAFGCHKTNVDDKDLRDFGVVNRDPAGSSYTGLAIGASNGRNYIYTANFGQKKIDEWDTAFQAVSMSFKDPGIPAGYSPWGVVMAPGTFLADHDMADDDSNDGHGGHGSTRDREAAMAAGLTIMDIMIPRIR